MLRRKIEQQLIDWKKTKSHNPLIIKGCRQCGKTFSVLDFANKNYENVVYLNFFENPAYSTVFEGSLNIDDIVMYLTALLECKATSGNTKSTKTILKHPEKYNVYHAIKLGNYNVGLANGILTLPLYMGFLIHDTLVFA